MFSFLFTSLTIIIGWSDCTDDCIPKWKYCGVGYVNKTWSKCGLEEGGECITYGLNHVYVVHDENRGRDGEREGGKGLVFQGHRYFSC